MEKPYVMMVFKSSGPQLLPIVSVLICFLISSVSAGALERIAISPDGKSFVKVPSNRPFVPYGFNYAPRNEMLEDHWDAHWPEIEGDFAEMRDLGANVVRIHLQYPAFMEAVDKPSSHALMKLREVLSLAERNQLYLDITGLACYKPKVTQPWYDQLDEGERWKAHAFFWETIAKTCTSSTAVFCYDLMNEPIVPGEKRKPGEWYSGALFGGFDFVQFITLDAARRPRDQIAREWSRQLKAAIRLHDQQHLVTVGLLPWDEKMKHLSGFIPETLAPELDFLSVHIYPEAVKVDAALVGLEKFAVGKPLVIEETFPLTCSTAELRVFMQRSRGIANGWIGHYFGQTERDLQAKDRITTISDAIMVEWLKLFRERAPLE